MNLSGQRSGQQKSPALGRAPEPIGADRQSPLRSRRVQERPDTLGLGTHQRIDVAVVGLVDVEDINASGSNRLERGQRTRARPTRVVPEPLEASILKEVLPRIRNMARCGLYKDCAEIERDMRNSPHYHLLLRDWFNDPLFCRHIDELCGEARRALDVDDVS